MAKQRFHREASQMTKCRLACNRDEKTRPPYYPILHAIVERRKDGQVRCSLQDQVGEWFLSCYSDMHTGIVLHNQGVESDQIKKILWEQSVQNQLSEVPKIQGTMLFCTDHCVQFLVGYMEVDIARKLMNACRTHSGVCIVLYRELRNSDLVIPAAVPFHQAEKIIHYLQGHSYMEYMQTVKQNYRT